jgi:hypothetical protein
MNFTSTTQKMVTDWLRGTPTTPPTSLTLAISSTPFLMDGSGMTEPPSANGYARQVIALTAESFVNGTGTTVKNTAPIVFGPCTNTPWPPISYVGLFNQAGVLLAQGPMAAAQTAAVGGTISFATNSLQFLLS